MTDLAWLLVVLALIPLQVLSAMAGHWLADWQHNRTYERRVREVLGEP